MTNQQKVIKTKVGILELAKQLGNVSQEITKMDTDTQYTFRDFMRECELFEYSKENFDLIKDINELELSERYIENQYFMLENGPTASSLGVVTESYFMESVTEETLIMLEAAEVAKRDNIFLRIIGLFKRAVGGIAKFFKGILKKVSGKWDAIEEQIVRKLDQLIEKQKKNAGAREYIEEFARECSEALDTAAKATRVIIDERPVSLRPSIFSWGKKKAQELRAAATDKRIALVLTAAAKSVIPVKVESTEEKPIMMVDDIEIISKEFERVANNPTPGGVSDLNEKIKARSTIEYKVIDFKEESIKDIIKTLEAILDQLNILEDKVKSGQAAHEENSHREPKNIIDRGLKYVTKSHDEMTSEGFESLRKALAIFQKITSGTLELYTSSYNLLEKVKVGILSGINRALSGADKAA